MPCISLFLFVSLLDLYVQSMGNTCSLGVCTNCCATDQFAMVFFGAYMKDLQGHFLILLPVASGAKGN